MRILDNFCPSFLNTFIKQFDHLNRMSENNPVEFRIFVEIENSLNLIEVMSNLRLVKREVWIWMIWRKKSRKIQLLSNRWEFQFLWCYLLFCPTRRWEDSSIRFKRVSIMFIYIESYLESRRLDLFGSFLFFFHIDGHNWIRLEIIQFIRKLANFKETMFRLSNTFSLQWYTSYLDYHCESPQSLIRDLTNLLKF